MNVSTFRSEFLRISAERGLFHQGSDLAELDELLCTRVVPGYIGFDATANSFHIGNLVQIMRLYWLQQTGHKPIVLMGGGTTRVGDPSGKDETRQLLTPEAIAANIAALTVTFTKFLKFGRGERDAIMVDNDEWLSQLQYVDMLRDVGRHFSVNRMLSMEAVKLRLDRQQELSFLEFNYMILQAYDFVELNRRYGCRLQMGGSEQWGNIVMGIDLGRRLGTPQLYCVTCPLITTADGAKMGKTAKGAIWLNPDRLSPYDYWQYWRNVVDADVGRFLRIFTTLPLEEIARLESLRGEEVNHAKKVLATEVTRLLHGEEAARQAAETAAETFEQGGAAAMLPTIYVEEARLRNGLKVLTAFLEAGLVSSLGDARRQIRGGGLRLNDVPVTDEAAVLGLADLHQHGVIKLSFGRKKHVLLKVQDASA